MKLLRGSLLGWLLATLSALYGFVIYSPMLQGKLGLIDDHEFIKYLSAGGRDINEIPVMLESAGLGDYGDGKRFRPTYAFLRVIGSVLHGTDGFSWYLARLLIFSLAIVGFVFFVWQLLSRTEFSRPIRTGLTFVFGIWVSSMASWQDIVMRLGPSELYMMAGLAVLLNASYLLLNKPSGGWYSILVFAGLGLSMGSKENMLFLVLPVMALFVIALLQNKSKIWISISAIASLGFTGYVGFGFLPAVLGSGSDVYGASRSMSGWLNALVQTSSFWIALAYLVALSIFVVKIIEKSLLEKYLYWILLSTPALGVASDAYFYQYSINMGQFSPARYGVLSEFMQILMILCLVIFGSKLVWGKSTTLRALSFLIAAIASMGPTAQVFTAFGYNNLARQNAEYLSYQYNALESVANEAKSKNIRQILYLVDEPYDYERIFASRLFLKYLADLNVEFYMWTNFSGVQFDQFTEPLARDLTEWSSSGDPNGEISPLKNLKTDESVLCVHFGTNPQGAPCDQSTWIGG